MTLEELHDEADQLVESFINGNRAHVVAETVTDRDPVTAAVLGISIYSRLRDYDDDPDDHPHAQSFWLMLEERL